MERSSRVLQHMKLTASQKRHKASYASERTKAGKLHRPWQRVPNAITAISPTKAARQDSKVDSDGGKALVRPPRVVGAGTLGMQ